MNRNDFLCRLRWLSLKLHPISYSQIAAKKGNLCTAYCESAKTYNIDQYRSISTQLILTVSADLNGPAAWPSLQAWLSRSAPRPNHWPARCSYAWMIAMAQGPWFWTTVTFGFIQFIQWCNLIFLVWASHMVHCTSSNVCACSLPLRASFDAGPVRPAARLWSCRNCSLVGKTWQNVGSHHFLKERERVHHSKESRSSPSLADSKWFSQARLLEKDFPWHGTWRIVTWSLGSLNHPRWQNGLLPSAWSISLLEPSKIPAHPLRAWTQLFLNGSCSEIGVWEFFSSF